MERSPPPAALTPVTEIAAPARPQALLLIADTARRLRLQACCEQAGVEVRSADPEDIGRAVFDAAPDRVDLLVLEQTQLQRQGVSLLASWRRMAPRSRLVLLGDDSGPDQERMEQALRDVQSHR